MQVSELFVLADSFGRRHTPCRLLRCGVGAGLHGGGKGAGQGQRQGPLRRSGAGVCPVPCREFNSLALGALAPVGDCAKYKSILQGRNLISGLSVGPFQSVESHTGKFQSLIFWANPDIISRFPFHSQVARSRFSGLPHEATSERAFSYSGCVVSDLRHSMATEQVCARVIRQAGVAHYSTMVEEIKQHHLAKRQVPPGQSARSSQAPSAGGAGAMAGAMAPCIKDGDGG